MDSIAAARYRPMSGTQADAGFDETFLLHYEAVYRFIYRIVGARDEAEDVAQETFLRLLRQPPAPRGSISLRAWLYKVAANLAYNALRADRRRELRHAKAAEAVGAADAADPALSAMTIDTRQAVRRALGKLSDRQSQLLLLRYAGLSYGELAAATGVAPGSVGTLLSRAEAAFEAAYLSLAGAGAAGGLSAPYGEDQDDL